MIDNIDGFLYGIIGSLRSKGMSDHDILDLLFTLIFWKYISDQSGKHKYSLNSNNHFNYVIRSKNSSIDQEMEEALGKWVKTNPTKCDNFYLINKQSIKQINKTELINLCFKLDKGFSNGWTWSPENSIAIFNAIESLFANSIGFAHFFLTPPEVVDLMSGLIIPGKKIRIYDPFCRSGELLSESIHQLKEVEQVVGNATNALSLKISTIKSVMLQFPDSKIKLESIYNGMNTKFDRIITNPPFGGKGERLHYEYNEWGNNFSGIRQELDFLCHVLDRLNEKGQAVVIIPVGILFSSGRIQQFRKQFIKSNILEAIISLPPKTFYQTGVKTAILFINRNKTSDEVLLINATKLGNRQRDRHKFSDEDIATLISLVNSFRAGKELDKKLDELYVKVHFSELEQNDFDLQFTTYKEDETDYNSSMRSSKEIWNEIISLKEGIDDCHKKISLLMKKR